MSENRNVVLNQIHEINNFMEIKNKEYTTPVITVGPEASIFETLMKMQLNFIKHIIVTAKNKPVGIVTERDVNKFLENDKTSRALQEIPIKHVMKKNVITITDGLEDHYSQCANRMATFKIGSVILEDSNGDLIGIVSKTDITKAYSAVYGGKYFVKDFMTSNVVTCRKSDSIKFALNMMNRNDISHLVVTNENGKPLGLITTNTFLTHSDYFTKGNTRTRDYLLPIGSKKDLHVEDLLGKELLTVELEDDLSTAANLMIKNTISGIPVIDKGQNLVGVITKFDIVRAFTLIGTHANLQTKYQNFY